MKKKAIIVSIVIGIIISVVGSAIWSAISEYEITIHIEKQKHGH